MNTCKYLVLVLGLVLALVLAGCAAMEKSASSGDKTSVKADVAKAGCSMPCAKSGDAKKAACCEKKKAEGKCPAAAGEKKADKGCPHSKKPCDKAKKSSGCPKEAAKPAKEGCGG